MKQALLNHSPFVQTQLEQNSELNKLINDDSFDLRKDWQSYLENHYLDDPFQLLRKYRKSRLALIALLDCKKSSKNHSNHKKALEQTSLLADLLIQQAYQIVKQEFEQKYGAVVNEKGHEVSLIVFALGKLGGQELNFSSDVDLVFCVDGSGHSNGDKSIDSNRYFDRFGRRLIQLLDSTTVDGRVYLVDMRLRPFGSAAPLVCSIEHLLNYLQTEGRDWERYAWLRARGIAGNTESIKNTIAAIQPFIYRKYLDYGIFESLRQIKNQIQRKQQSDLENIKLGRGGIREIEFIVQTLQLTFAGRDKSLRGADLFDSIHRLNDKNHLDNREKEQLIEAWLFLRKLENYCQIIDDQNRHHLPENCENLAILFNLKSEEQLLKHWQDHRKNVHGIFSKTFIKNQNLDENKTCSSQIQSMKDMVANKKLPKQIKHKVYKAYDAFDLHFRQLSENQEEVLNRFNDILKVITKRSSYLSMLIESPFVLKNLVSHLNSVPYFFDSIKKMPQLFELLFEKQNLSDSDFQNLWEKYLSQHSPVDEEDTLELLCQFKARMQFIIISDYIFNNENVKTYCQKLSELAETLLKQSIIATHKALFIKGFEIELEKLMVIAYGSLAAKTMNLSSDFDLVFLWDGEINANNQKLIFKWIKRLIHFLSTPNYFGNLYAIDTQLRPNGNSGTLVVSRDNFEQYQTQKAWIWEQAALVKTRCVFASSPQKQWFNDLRRKVLQTPREESVVDKELNEMESKLIKHKGKSHNEDFILLGTILKKSNQFPELTEWNKIYEVLHDQNLLPQKLINKIKNQSKVTLKTKLEKSLLQ